MMPLDLLRIAFIIERFGIDVSVFTSIQFWLDFNNKRDGEDA